MRFLRYPGGKTKLISFLKYHIPKSSDIVGDYIEPFVGGCNTMSQVGGKRYGYDSNPYLIAMWKQLQKGWIPKPINKANPAYPRIIL